MDAEVKHCRMCSMDKPLEAFGRMGNGCQSYCKECRNKQRKERYQQNRQKELEWRREYRETNPDSIKEYSRKYREAIYADPEKLRIWREARATWLASLSPEKRDLMKERMREGSRRRYWENHEKSKERSRLWMRKARNELYDSYIRMRLKRTMPAEAITANVIEETRQRWILKRAAKGKAAQ